jgi:hypothetical protein
MKNYKDKLKVSPIKLLSLILILQTISINCRADTAVPVVKGNPAPFNGVLMDNEKANKVDNAIKERDLYKQIMNNTNDILYKEQDKVKILIQQNEKLLKQQSLTDLEKYLLFGLGIATTIGAGVLVKNIIK